MEKRKNVEVSTESVETYQETIKEEKNITDMADYSDITETEKRKKKKKYINNPDSEELARLMTEIPIANIKGAGSTQENRCTSSEIKAIVEATRACYGISKNTDRKSVV